ncbi:hypothetical protein DFH09DRAFT_1100538 [Mycena vulgaris]|nr:hypothetical protein DFH09DRAFT_1100538 [Mycena vulgaris]
MADRVLTARTLLEETGSSDRRPGNPNIGVAGIGYRDGNFFLMDSITGKYSRRTEALQEATAMGTRTRCSIIEDAGGYVSGSHKPRTRRQGINEYGLNGRGVFLVPLARESLESRCCGNVSAEAQVLNYEKIRGVNGHTNEQAVRETRDENGN